MNVLDELIADLDGDPYRDFNVTSVKDLLARLVRYLKEREAPPASVERALDELVADLNGDPYREFDTEDVLRMLTRVKAARGGVGEDTKAAIGAPVPAPPAKVFVVLCNDAVVAVFPDEKVADSICRKLKTEAARAAPERVYFWHVKEAVTTPERAWIEGRMRMGLRP